MIEDAQLVFFLGGFGLLLVGTWKKRSSLVLLAGLCLISAGVTMVMQSLAYGVDYGQPIWVGPITGAGAIFVGITCVLPGVRRRELSDQQQDKARRSKGLCCWCLRRRAVRWHRLNTSKPNHVEREGRCWLHWSRTPGPRSDLEAC